MLAETVHSNLRLRKRLSVGGFFQPFAVPAGATRQFFTLSGLLGGSPPALRTNLTPEQAIRVRNIWCNIEPNAASDNGLLSLGNCAVQLIDGPTIGPGVAVSGVAPSSTPQNPLYGAGFTLQQNDLPLIEYGDYLATFNAGPLAEIGLDLWLEMSNSDAAPRNFNVTLVAVFLIYDLVDVSHLPRERQLLATLRGLLQSVP